MHPILIYEDLMIKDYVRLNGRQMMSKIYKLILMGINASFFFFSDKLYLNVKL